MNSESFVFFLKLIIEDRKIPQIFSQTGKWLKKKKVTNADVFFFVKEVSVS